jgi:hypothetical protein
MVTMIEAGTDIKDGVKQYGMDCIVYCFDVFNWSARSYGTDQAGPTDQDNRSKPQLKEPPLGGP